MPVHVEHDADHAGQGQHVDDAAEKCRCDEVLDGRDVARQARQEIALARLGVLGERQALDVLIQRQTQIVGDPLADLGGERLLRVPAGSADEGDEPHRRDRKVDRRVPVAREEAGDKCVEPPRESFRLHHVVYNDLEGPGLKQVRDGSAEDGKERERQALPVRTKEAPDPQLG